jgi:hypothetical protein
MDMDILDATENLQKTTLLNNLQKIKTHTQSLESSINKRNQYLKDL